VSFPNPPRFFYNFSLPCFTPPFDSSCSSFRLFFSCFFCFFYVLRIFVVGLETTFPCAFFWFFFFGGGGQPGVWFRWSGFPFSLFFAFPPTHVDVGGPALSRRPTRGLNSLGFPPFFSFLYFFFLLLWVFSGAFSFLSVIPPPLQFFCPQNTPTTPLVWFLFLWGGVFFFPFLGAFFFNTLFFSPRGLRPKGPA